MKKSLLYFVLIIASFIVISACKKGPERVYAIEGNWNMDHQVIHTYHNDYKLDDFTEYFPKGGVTINFVDGKVSWAVVGGAVKKGTYTYSDGKIKLTYDNGENWVLEVKDLTDDVLVTSHKEYDSPFIGVVERYYSKVK